MLIASAQNQTYQMPNQTNRRYDIDWIRVIVFDFLIFYHVGMLFVWWGFHIKNNEIVEWVQYPMIFVNQWRLSILFVVSGMGTLFALSRRSGGKYIKERFIRLFIPLLVGVLLIVPPQVYIERIVNGQTDSSYWQFWPTIFEGVYPSGNFSWHHLWFLPYLLVMSILVTPFFLRLRKENNGFILWFKNWISTRPNRLFLLFIPLFMVDIGLEPHFPQTHALIGDWFLLTKYTVLFIYGYLLVSIGDVFWESVKSIRHYALIAGLIGFPSLLWLFENWDPSFMIPLVRSLNSWCWILTIFGYAAYYLNHDSKVIAYRNEAVYPFYILHQTIMMIVAFFLIDMSMYWGIKFLILVVTTFGGSWVLYEFIIRRIKLIRPLFGLKNRS